MFIHTLFDNLAAHPDQPFVVEMHGAEAVSATGRDLAARIGRFRRALRDRGVSTGDRVVLLSPNSIRWVAADLAILAEGAIVVPMYARQDPDELVAMMHDCAPTAVIVVDEDMRGAIEARWADAPLVTMADLDATAGTVDEQPAPRDAADPVTIIYTSGTSGEPKGVVLTVGNVDYMLPQTRDHLDRMMGPRDGVDTVFHYLPFCFAGSRVVLWTCLFKSNPIHISTNLDDLATEMGAVKPHYFLNVPVLLERIKNAVEQGVRGRPAPIQWLYDTGKAAWGRIAAGDARKRDAVVYAAARRIVFDAIRKKVGPNLRCLICGSAPLGPDTQLWFQMIGIPVYQVYGLTETTAIVTMDAPPKPARPGHVGFALPGVETRITEEGELLVKGPNIFPEYWNKPDVTATAFVDGWFRTGDQVERTEDGYWRIIGRVKNLLVPSSGHNVAPEPIEQKLVETIEGVEHAVLVGHGRPFLAAILTGDVNEETLEEAIARVNAELPHYRRVRRWHVSDVPLTIDNGLLTATSKLKRAAIEAAFADAIEAMYAE